MSILKRNEKNFLNDHKNFRDKYNMIKEKTGKKIFEKKTIDLENLRIKEKMKKEQEKLINLKNHNKEIEKIVKRFSELKIFLNEIKNIDEKK